MAAPDRPSQEGATPSGTIIHRKAQAGRAEHQARAMSLAKALRLTLAKVANDMFDMSMAVIGARVETCSGDMLSEQLQDPGLLMLLDGPGRSRGAAVFDEPLVGGLIQQQTMGKVLRQTDDTPRILTQTDAAICAPFLDTLLTRTAPVPEDPKEQRLINDFRFGAWVEDTRLLCMALEEDTYVLIHLSLDIAGGARQGKILLCMPKPGTMISDTDGEADTASADEDTRKHPNTSARLSETVMNLNAPLRITLAQIKLPLGELRTFQVGSCLSLTGANFDNVRIQTITGAPVGRGKLGQLEGMRAVQVETTASAALSPKRRASDREDLMLPDISGDPDGRSMHPPQEAAALPDMTDLPDMSDLPDLPDFDASETLDELPELPDLPDLSDLPELPDMSDLPELDLDLDQVKLNTG